MYKIVSFPDIHPRFTILLSLSPLFLYHSHHPRNKAICQADIITTFTNICYRPLSMLLLLLLSFRMYELVLISPRKANAWINVSESIRLNERSTCIKKHMYKNSICIKTACALFVHAGSVLSITCGKGHIEEDTCSLARKGRADRGRVRESNPSCKLSQPFLKKRCGYSLGLWCLCVLLPRRSQRKGLANSSPMEPEEQSRSRTEHQSTSGTRAKRPKDVVAACEVEGWFGWNVWGDRYLFVVFKLAPFKIRVAVAENSPHLGRPLTVLSCAECE